MESSSLPLRHIQFRSENSPVVSFPCFFQDAGATTVVLQSRVTGTVRHLSQLVKDIVKPWITAALMPRATSPANLLQACSTSTSVVRCHTLPLRTLLQRHCAFATVPTAMPDCRKVLLRACQLWLAVAAQLRADRGHCLLLLVHTARTQALLRSCLSCLC